MIASKDFQGHEARAVNKVLTFLETMHNDLGKQIDAMQPKEEVIAAEAPEASEVKAQ